MKQIDIYIPFENVSDATQILHKHEVGGISLSEIKGRGRVPHEPVPEMVRAYTYGKKNGTRIRIQDTYVDNVPDSKLKPVIDDLLKLTPTRGKVFVRDVLEAYDLASKSTRESAI